MCGVRKVHPTANQTLLIGGYGVRLPCWGRILSPSPPPKQLWESRENSQLWLLHPPQNFQVAEGCLDWGPIPWKGWGQLLWV